MIDWKTCQHKWVAVFGPCLRCSVCGASSIYSFGGESKPILPPIIIDDEEPTE